MKCFFILIFSIALSGCVSGNLADNELSYKDLNEYMSQKEILGTPRDNLIVGDFICFSDYNDSGSFEIDTVSAFQFNHGDDFYYENFYSWDLKEQIKTKIDYSQESTFNNLDGVLIQLELVEDENGEFYTNALFEKTRLIKNKSINRNEKDVFKKIVFNKTYYPKNKLPYRFFEDKEEICYITLSW